MTICAYMSDLSPWWTFERQESVLAALLARKPKVFRDVRPGRGGGIHTPAPLTDRAAMLRPTTRAVRGYTIHVASLAVLATTEAEFRDVWAAVLARGSGLVSADDGPFTDPVAAWARARTKSRLEGAALRGGAVTQRKAKATYGARFAKIVDRWGDPAWPTATLLAEAGDDAGKPMSRNTANKYAGMTRERAVKLNEARLKRAQRKEQSGAR